MKIRLKEWKVKETLFKLIEEVKLDNTPKKKENSFNLAFGNFIPDDNKNEFGIGFQVEVKDEEFTLNVEMVFLFDTDSKLPDNFKDSPFANINAPAIAFPYLRAFISNFTLQAGFPPVMLPSVNFVEFKNKDKEEESFDQGTKDE